MIGELTAAEDAAISAALSTLPPMSDEALDRVAALWAAMDAQAADARRRADAKAARPARKAVARPARGEES